MNLTMLLDMVVEGMPDRVLIGDRADGLTASELARRARSGSDLVRAADAGTVVYLGGNGPAFPVALFAAASVGVPFLPVNYRLSAEQLDDVLGRQAKPLVITDSPERVRGMAAVTLEEFAGPTAVAADHETEPADPDPDAIAVLLFTSGTTGEPKAAVLRHRHLTSYVIGTVEFASARARTRRPLVSVPPYHIAGISATCCPPATAAAGSCTCRSSTPTAWVATRPRPRRITHAMVVPTMLGRILDVIEPRRRAEPADAAPPVLRRRAHARRPVRRAGAAAASRTSASSTPTASPRPARRSPCWAPTTTAAAVDRDDPAVRAPAGLGRPAAARRRDRDPRPDGQPCRSRRARARSACAASRSPASTCGRQRARRRRLVPHPRRRLARRGRLPLRRGPRSTT